MIAKGLLHAYTSVNLDDSVVQLLVRIRRQLRPRATLEQPLRQNVSLENLDLTPNRDSRLRKDVFVDTSAFLSHDPTLEGNI